VKNKRPKSSLFYDSTKNKRRKQEKSCNLNRFNNRNFSISEKNTNPSMKKRHYAHKTEGNLFRNHSASTPFFLDDSAPLTRPNYTYKKGEEKQTYCYDFTNSRFIYFLGKLEPKPYLVFVSLVSLLICEDLNVTETRIIYSFISNIADTIQTIFDQEVILNNYNQAKETRALNNALHEDFEQIYAELDNLKKKLSN